MNLSLKIALRYIFTKRSFNFITVITLISTLGITVGVAVLIIVLSIFNGFRDLTEQQIVGFDPHVRIVPQDGAYIEDYQPLINMLDTVGGVKSYAAIFQRRVVAHKENSLHVFNLNSVLLENNDYFSSTNNSMVFGSFKVESEKMPGLTLGIALADRMMVMPNDTITLLSPDMIERSMRMYSRAKGIETVVKGIYQTNIKDFDIMYGFTSSEAAAKLFNLPKPPATSIDIRADNVDDAILLKNKIKKFLPDTYKLLTWQDLNKELYRIMRFERMSTFIILSLIVLLAVFNILASLAMTVVEKKPDIALLKALGATRKMIRNIFLLEGMVIGFLSTFAGTVLGLAFSYGQLHFKWLKIDGNKYIIDAIPISVNIYDVIVIAVMSLVLSLLATLYPSKRAQDINIVESIRPEN